MNQVERYIFEESLDIGQCLDRISNAFKVLKEEAFQERRTYYDTFDWRLFKKGMGFYDSGSMYRLIRLEDDVCAGELTHDAERAPKFWWDVADEAFKKALKPLLNIRALIPVVEVEKRNQGVRVLNADEKTVARISFEEILIIQDGKAAPLPQLIQLKPVRGYQKELLRCKRLLLDLGLREEERPDLAIALEAAGQKPGEYSPQIRIQIMPQWTTRHAACVIFLQLLDIMRQNESGILEDIDTEYLHEFRTAVRRTRSGLSRIKGALPQEDIDRFKRDFASLQSATNALRDLDVYLLRKREYNAMLPADLQLGLVTFFKFLSESRAVEYQKLVEFLHSDSYKTIISSWKEYLVNTLKRAGVTGANFDEPVVERARKSINRQYKRVRQFWSRTESATTNEEIHKLRIEMKKLRYTLEFFSSLFPERNMKLILKQFKKLQNRLGDFNDLAVQQGKLEAYLKDYQHNDKIDVHVAASIGGLISRLHQKQQQVREAIDPLYHAMSEQANGKVFKDLFKEV